jgi:hypothetical protein
VLADFAPQDDPGTHQISDINHHLHLPKTLLTTVLSSFVCGRGGSRAWASCRSEAEKTSERLREGVSGKKR